MNDPRRGRGFTLVELLVVVAVIGILIGVLLPALAGARDGARTSQASNNVRQITLALSAYANDNEFNFPPIMQGIDDPQTGKENQIWFDQNRIGRYLPQLDATNLDPDNPKNPTVGGGVMVSPSHPLGARSFCMNYWAASAVKPWQDAGSNGRWRYNRPGQISAASPYPDEENDRGVPFNATVDRASDVFVIADAWGFWPSENGGAEESWFTGSQIGFEGLPGERFGAGDDPFNVALSEGNLWQNAPEFAGVTNNQVTSYIPFYRYPKSRVAEPLTRNGSALFGFVDGHVGLLSTSDLVDDTSGRSAYKALWTPKDRQIEAAELGSQTP